MTKSFQNVFFMICLVALTACGTKAADGANTPTAASGTHVSSTPTPAPADTTPVPPPVCTTQGTANVNVVVQTKVGPHGEAAPLPVSNTLYSQNIYDQGREQYVPHADDAYVAFLGALRPAYLRWPAGYYSQTYTFMPNGPEGQFNMTPALITAFMELCKRSGAQPMIGVNIESSTADNAAAFVTYVNKTMGYNVQWWEIGNEPDVDGLDGTHSPAIYAAKYAAFAAAMKKADPSIKLSGAVLMTGEDVLGQHDDADWLTPILDAVGPSMNAVAWHYYPLYSSTQSNNTSSSSMSVDHLLQEDAQDWPPAGLDFADSVIPYMRNLIAQKAPGAQIWIDEFAEDPGYAAGAGLSDTYAGALWAADALGRYADYGVEQIYKFIFRAHPEHKYTLLDDNEVPRPEYYTYWLYAQHFGDRMVKAASDQVSVVASHASLNSSDKSLRLLLVNKQSTAQTVHVTLPDFKPRTATQYLLQSNAIDSSQATLNGQQLTMDNIGKGANAIAAAHAEACTDNILTMPPYSVMLVTFNP